MRLGIIFILLTMSLLGYSQPTWIQQTSGVNDYLFDIEFVDINIGYAVGENGVILKTDNGGNTWVQQNSGTIVDLFNVNFADSQTGWVCGSSGHLLYTTDGGNLWTTVNLSSSVQFTTMDFINGNEGFISGKNTASGFVETYKTDDAGLTWNFINSPTSLSEVLDVEFSDDQNGFLVSYTEIYSTNNGGTTWQFVTSPTGSQTNRIEMYDTNYGWLSCGNGEVYFTSNGGANWSPQTTSTTSTLWEISIVDLNNVFIVGHDGTIISTADGGVNWINNTSSTTSILPSCSAVDPNSAWTCGENGGIYRMDPGLSDLSIVNYTSETIACPNQDFVVELSVANNGFAPVTNATFSIYDGSNLLLEFPWTGSIDAGTSDLIEIGTIELFTSTTITIEITGDDVTTNNTYDQYIDVYNDNVGTNGPISTCEGQLVELSAYGGDSYIWYINDIADSTLADQSVIAYSYETFYVDIKTVNCTYEDSVVVEIVNSNCITNAFSPNDDGVNDFFIIDMLGTGDNWVTIFNRWGDELISFENYNNIDVIWDGTDYDGVKVSAGTYYYSIDGTNNSYAGMVQVIR